MDLLGIIAFLAGFLLAHWMYKRTEKIAENASKKVKEDLDNDREITFVD